MRKVGPGGTILAAFMTLMAGLAVADEPQDPQWRMNDVAHCPDKPFGTWYMFFEPYNLTIDKSIFIGPDIIDMKIEHFGPLPYEMKTTQNGQTYVQLIKEQRSSPDLQDTYLYLRYMNVTDRTALTERYKLGSINVDPENPCILQLFQCWDEQDVLDRIRFESGLSTDADEKGNCSVGRYADHNKPAEE